MMTSRVVKFEEKSLLAVFIPRETKDAIQSTIFDFFHTQESSHLYVLTLHCNNS